MKVSVIHDSVTLEAESFGDHALLRALVSLFTWSKGSVDVKLEEPDSTGSVEWSTPPDIPIPECVTCGRDSLQSVGKGASRTYTCLGCGAIVRHVPEEHI